MAFDLALSGAIGASGERYFEIVNGNEIRSTPSVRGNGCRGGFGARSGNQEHRSCRRFRLLVEIPQSKRQPEQSCDLIPNSNAGVAQKNQHIVVVYWLAIPNQVIRILKLGVPKVEMIRPTLAFTEEKSARTVAEILDRGAIGYNLDTCNNGSKTFHPTSVDEPEQARAVEIVEASDAVGAAVRCPGCNSLGLEFPAKPGASGLISAPNAVAEAVVPATEKPFCCDNCAYYW